MTLILFLLACICPIIAIPFILQHYRKTGKTKLCSLLCGIACSAALYGYVADRGNDIYRHIFNLHYYVNIPIWKAFDAGPLNAVYIWDIWQWIIAHLNNEFLMQASGALIGYTLVIYMILDYAQRRGVEPKQYLLAVTLAFSTISPLGMAVGIRSSNAFAMCAFAVYLYFVHEKSYLLSLAIICASIFLHHGTIVIVAVWFMYPLFKKRPLFGATLIVIVLMTYTNYESYISYFMGGGPIFESMGTDLQKSVAEYTGSRVQSMHSIVTLIIQTGLVTLLFIRGRGLAQLSLLRKKDEMEISVRSINEFQILMLVTTYTLIALLSYNGNRYYAILLYLSFLPLMDSISDAPFTHIKKYIVIDLVIIGLALATTFILLHDMNWGTGSLGSFILSLFTGYFSRLFI